MSPWDFRKLSELLIEAVRSGGVVQGVAAAAGGDVEVWLMHILGGSSPISAANSP